MGKYKVKAISLGRNKKRAAAKLAKELNRVSAAGRDLMDLRIVDKHYMVISVMPDPPPPMGMPMAPNIENLGGVLARAIASRPPRILDAVMNDWRQRRGSIPKEKRDEACLNLFTTHDNLRGMNAFQLAELRESLEKYLVSHSETCMDKESCSVHEVTSEAIKALTEMPRAMLQ